MKVKHKKTIIIVSKRRRKRRLRDRKIRGTRNN